MTFMLFDQPQLMRERNRTKQYNNILLLDDSELNNLLNAQFLNFALPQSKITSYEDASLLLRLLCEGALAAPDLILLDVNMPELNGWEFIEELDENNVEVEVIMLSSSRHFKDIEKADNYSRVRGYIEKPLTEAKIEQHILGMEPSEQ